MTKLSSKSWWIESVERLIKTFCQTAVALIGANAVGLMDVNWVGVASGAALASVLSILTSIAALPDRNADWGNNAS